MRLQGKVALVTGGSSGIGKATALLMAKEGARLGLLDLEADDLDRMVARIEKSGGEAIALPADVSRADQVERAVAETVSRFGRIDVVFANAGINGVWAPIEELSPEEFEQTIAVNLVGTFLTVKYAIPHMKKRGGSVIVTSSINGTRVFSNTGATAYSCSKAGQVALAKMVALEVAPFGIRINVICPGSVETNIEESTERRDLDDIRFPVEFPEGEIPLKPGRAARAEEVAQLVLFLASDESRHISGTEVWIDATQSLLLG